SPCARLISNVGNAAHIAVRWRCPNAAPDKGATWRKRILEGWAREENAITAAREHPAGLPLQSRVQSWLASSRWIDGIDSHTRYRVRTKICPTNTRDQRIRSRPAHAWIGNKSRVLDRFFHGVARAVVAGGGEKGYAIGRRVDHALAHLLKRRQAIVK